jgi:hypothetical protein
MLLYQPSTKDMNMNIIESTVPYNYMTIKLTQSRIDKGLLAIPVSLIDNFPKKRINVMIYFNESQATIGKNFTPYDSSSRECRIGGMRNFYDKNNVKTGDEVVIQFLGKYQYRILTERKFKSLVNKYQIFLDTSKTDRNVEKNIQLISQITNASKEQIVTSEFARLSKSQIERRKYQKERFTRTKENVPPSIRRILADIYKGRCQLTDFGFLMKNGEPYFEIHHIKPDYGHHLKNLIVVCPNIHAQFEYTNIKEYFDDEGWLRRVKFNSQTYIVKQFIDHVQLKFSKEVHLPN